MSFHPHIKSTGMQKAVLFLVVLFLSTVLSGQIILQGKIRDVQTHQPIPGASVYFNNTSVGTSTDSAGEFVLRSSQLLDGELVVSSVGYEKWSTRISADDASGKRFVVEMKAKEKLIKDVLVLSDASRQKWLAIFKDQFLGITKEAERSVIKNLKDIYFTAGNEAGSFKAYADSPLVIKNNQLGYVLYFDLIEFGYNSKEGSTYFFGYTRFESMGDTKKWVKNRKRCYLGSSKHFFRSLIRDQLKKEGFNAYQVVPMLQEGVASTKRLSIKANNQPMMAVPCLAADILKRDSTDANQYIVTLKKNQLMVTSDWEPDILSSLVTKVLLSRRNGKYDAEVNAPEGTIMLNKNGIVLNPLSITYQGYWIYEKAANMLPDDFQPEEKD